MIAAFTSAWCTLSLRVADRSLKMLWSGWTQALQNAVEMIHTETMNGNVPQCIVQGYYVLLQVQVDSEVGEEHQEERTKRLATPLFIMESGDESIRYLTIPYTYKVLYHVYVKVPYFTYSTSLP